MTIKEKMKLMERYKDLTGKSLDIRIDESGKVVKEVSIGKPSTVNHNIGYDSNKRSRNLDVVEESESKQEHLQFAPVMNDDISYMNAEGVIATDIMDSMDGMLIGQNAGSNSKSEELYNRLKELIFNIKCDDGINSAYKQFDDMLSGLVSLDKGSLTNSQLIVLVSLMITKLDELNKMNYPEMTLESVSKEIETNGHKALYSSKEIAYFFEGFYDYYTEEEWKQFEKAKKMYCGRENELKKFQMGKQKILHDLLSWLIS